MPEELAAAALGATCVARRAGTDRRLSRPQRCLDRAGRRVPRELFRLIPLYSMLSTRHSNSV